MARQMTYYMAPEAESVIGNYKERGSFNSRANSIIIRYGAICKKDCPEMTVSEWMACCDVLNGTVRDTDSYWNDPARMIHANIEDSEQDGLGEKWGIDCKEFSSRLREMPYSSQCAIVEVVSRFWAGHDSQEWESDQQRLEHFGARIKGE